jgi:hypothetical protein
MAFLLRMFTCILVAGLFLYLYIDKQNELTELRLQVPIAAKDLQRIREENNRLQYDIDSFESPIHLMELAEKPAYSHLKHPYQRDILILPSGKLEGSEQ